MGKNRVYKSENLPASVVKAKALSISNCPS